MSSTDNNTGNTTTSYLAYKIKNLLSLEDDKEENETTIANIKRGIEFKGSNLWILIFAIFIASIGLNFNSPAVIIGAMLISPLMGPIIGIGLGIGINDLVLIKRALINLSIAVIMSVITSAIYFLISPISEAQSELLARTTPTIWDVLIALFGGLAGIIAFSRKDKSNAIPGVAIATALMPPLCTAGYGLATSNLQYFLGAFYLFFINGVFICLSTFLIVRYQGYPKKHFADQRREKKVKTSILIFAIITISPSIYTAYSVVQKSIFERNAIRFIQNELNFPDTYIISKDIKFLKDKRNIEVILIGAHVNDSSISRAKVKLKNYHLANANLKIFQNEYRNPDVTFLQEEKNKASLMEDLYKKKEAELVKKDTIINDLMRVQSESRLMETLIMDISKEIKVQYPSVQEFTISKAINTKIDSLKTDTVYFAYIKFKNQVPGNTKNTLEKWLKIRIKKENLKLVTEY